MKKRGRLTGKKKAPPFKAALVAARVTLAQKRKRRLLVMGELKQLNDEIPDLERTVKALEQQLDAKPLMDEKTRAMVDEKYYEPMRTNHPEVDVMINAPVGGGDDIPPEIRAQLPPEDLTGMGSHFGATEEEAQFLPEIDGNDPTKAQGKVAKDKSPSRG